MNVPQLWEESRRCDTDGTFGFTRKSRWPYLAVSQVPCLVTQRDGAERRWLRIAVASDGEEHRQVLGVASPSPPGAKAWSEFFTRLCARGLTDLSLVVGSNSAALGAALERTVSGCAWQWSRCNAQRVLAAAAPADRAAEVGQLVGSIFEQQDAVAARRRLVAARRQLSELAPAAHDLLISTDADLVAFTTTPPAHWSFASCACVVDEVAERLRHRLAMAGVLSEDVALRIARSVLADARAS